MDRSQTKQKFLMQGSILAIAGILVRLIGLFYHLPMIAIIGTKGNGYYSTAYSVYSLFLIISSYSFPTAISKILSQRLANGRFLDAKNVIKVSLTIAFFVGLLMFCLMYFGSEIISISYRKTELRFALRALAPTLFIMSFLSVLRGVFQGTGNMVPTAVSQIFEQIVNAVTSVLFAYILFNKGKIANLVYGSDEYSYAFGAQGGAIGTGLGAFTAIVFLIFLFAKLYRKHKKFLSNNNYYEPESKSKIYLLFFSIVVPMIMSSTIYNISTVLDNFIFFNAMSYIKTELNVVVLWGIYANYHLLFNIPVAVSNSLTSSIIPSISYSVAQKDVRQVVMKVKYSFKYTMLIVIPAFIGFLVLAEPICITLFRSNSSDTLINVLRIGSIAVVFFSLSTVTNGILHGLGIYDAPVKNAIVALLIHIVLLIVLLVPLKLNIYAIVISMIVFSIILFLLNKNTINNFIRYNNRNFKRRTIINYFLMIVSAIFMGVAALFCNKILSNSILTNDYYIYILIRLIICIAASIFIYLFFIIILGVIRKRDIEYIPFISKLSIFLRG